RTTRSRFSPWAMRRATRASIRPSTPRGRSSRSRCSQAISPSFSIDEPDAARRRQAFKRHPMTRNRSRLAMRTNSIPAGNALVHPAFTPEHPKAEHDLAITRRQLFGRAALGVGTAALASLLGRDLIAAGADPRTGTHHAPRAKRVIYLFMSGGPSHHDLWDYKPKLNDLFGKQLPEHVRDGQRITGMTSNQSNGLPIAPSKYKFEHCENHDRGIWVSELLPHTAKVVKNLCVIHSDFTEAINHVPAITYIQTGAQVPGRPSLGAWLSYGLGSMNDDLPSYVVMHARSHFAEQSLFNRLWGTGFLPSDHQGMLL